MISIFRAVLAVVFFLPFSAAYADTPPLPFADVLRVHNEMLDRIRGTALQVKQEVASRYRLNPDQLPDIELSLPASDRFFFETLEALESLPEAFATIGGAALRAILEIEVILISSDGSIPPDIENLVRRTQLIGKIELFPRCPAAISPLLDVGIEVVTGDFETKDRFLDLRICLWPRGTKYLADLRDVRETERLVRVAMDQTISATTLEPFIE